MYILYKIYNMIYLLYIKKIKIITNSFNITTKLLDYLMIKIYSFHW